MSMRDRLVPDDLVADQKPAVIWYDKKAIDQWRENLPNLTDLIDFRPLPHRYKSNWRILHIDGFEPGYRPSTIHFDFKVGVAPGLRETQSCNYCDFRGNGFDVTNHMLRRHSPGDLPAKV